MIKSLVLPIKQSFSKPFLFHPYFLIFIYLLHAYLIIPKEDIHVTNFILSLSIFLILNYTLQALYYFLLKEKIKSSILTSFTLLIFLFYVDIHVLLYKIHVFAAIRTLLPIPTIILFFFPFLTLIYFILKKTSFNLSRLNTYFNYLTFFLFSYNIIECVSSTTRSEIILTDPFEPNKVILQEDCPNIIYIVLDSYTSSGSLKKYWGFNDSAFENHLTERGFFISKNSRSFYTGTPFSIAASLNMSKLKHDSHINESVELNVKLFKLIRENRLVKFLNTYHYLIYNYSPFDIGDQTKLYYMDGYFNEKNFLSRTFFAIIFRNLEDQKLIKTNLSIFKKVEQVPFHLTKLPKFVYAHIMMPHFPYYFDENGNIMPQSYSGSSAVVMNDILKDKNKYLSQLIYANKLTCQTIDHILKTTESNVNKPIIIIQGDHGFRFLNDGADKIRESHTIFNAYYFPDNDYKMVNDSVNPVNSFRIILNKYFHANVNLLDTKKINE